MLASPASTAQAVVHKGWTRPGPVLSVGSTEVNRRMGRLSPARAWVAPAQKTKPGEAESEHGQRSGLRRVDRRGRGGDQPRVRKQSLTDVILGAPSAAPWVALTSVSQNERPLRGSGI